LDIVSALIIDESPWTCSWICVREGEVSLVTVY